MDGNVDFHELLTQIESVHEWTKDDNTYVLISVVLDQENGSPTLPSLNERYIRDFRGRIAPDTVLANVLQYVHQKVCGTDNMGAHKLLEDNIKDLRDLLDVVRSLSDRETYSEMISAWKENVACPHHSVASTSMES